MAWLSAPALGQSGAISAQALQPGVLVAEQSCAAHPQQSYAIYVPANYTAAKRWPIVYAFDPAARGTIPVELMKDAAERLGYIVVGSNNSHNGSAQAEGEAAQAMFEDTHTRLTLDDRRIYFAGFSGGARLAAAIAGRCKCAAGVLLNGAGFPPTAPPSRNAVFPVFASVGSFDFNFGEVIQLDEMLESLGFPHTLRQFEGGHEWAPAKVLEEALAWFRLASIKEGREPRDDGFVAAQAAAAASRARDFEQSGDLYLAVREYRQAARVFDGLSDTSALRNASASLQSQKPARDGAKREKQDLAEQNRLSQGIISDLALWSMDGSNRLDIFHALELAIVALRERTAGEKHADKIRVLRRCVSGVFVQLMETGQQRLEEKNFGWARDYFRLAADADPDSAWAFSSLAVAQALHGDRQAAFEALRRTKEKWKNTAAPFSKWLREEPAFAKLRDEAQFRTLANDSPLSK